jgi:predicted phosphodiesterase
VARKRKGLQVRRGPAAPPTRSRAGEAVIAVLSCTHSPFTPPTVHRWLLDTLGSLKGVTHLVHLGDIFEASAASVHPDESQHDLLDEYKHAAAFMASLRSVLPRRTVCHAIMGNHDDNLQAADPRRIPAALRGVSNFLHVEPFASEAKHWKWTEYRKDRSGCLEIGPVILTHGFDAGRSSDELEAIQFSNFCGGHSHRLVVRGHTHRPVPPTQCRRTAAIPLPWWYMNVGTCGPLQPTWMRRKDTSQWGAALGLIRCNMRAVPPFNLKDWDAQLLRMPDVF